MGGIYSPHTPQKGSRHIARREEWRNLDNFGSRDMAGAFSGGSGGIDTPRAPVTKVSVTSSPTNQNLKTGGYGIRPYETTGILLTLLSFCPKKNGPQKRNAHRRRSLPSANTGRAPSGMGPAMFAPTQWGTPKTFPKKVFAELFP